jgi:hypothetical protein
MSMIGTVRATLLACVLMLVYSTPRSDIPARDVEFVDARALHALVLEYFGPCQAGQFLATLENAGARPCPLRDVAPGWTCLDDGRSTRHALMRLIDEAGRIRQDNLREFLERVNAGDMLRGHLIARHGGDYVIRLAVETEDGARYLVSRNVYKDGRVGVWRFPLAVRP